MRSLIIILSALLSFTNLLSQDILTLDEAIQITVENNFAIKMANNDIKIAENNTSKEFLGYNPTVNAQANVSSDFSNNKTNFSSGENITTGYAFSYGANASITSNYALIDPSRNQNMKQLKAILQSTKVQKRLTIENNIANVMSAYYEVARIRENITLLENTINLSQDRLKRVKVANEYGQSDKLAVLNAQVDIDRDSINLSNSLLQLNNAKRNLNNLMGRDIKAAFIVEPITELVNSYDLDILINDLHSQNASVILIDQNIHVTERNFDIIESTKKPSLIGSASYSYNYSKSAPGSFFSSSQNDGIGLGLSLNYNIYDGGLRKVQTQNTQITIEGLNLQKDELINNLTTDLTNAWYEYQNALLIIDKENSNVTTSKVNFDKTEQQYRSGLLGSVEYRQAQLNLLSAENSRTNAKYNAKQIEIQLKLLSGNLIHE